MTFLRTQKAAGMAEYSIVAGLVAVACIGAVLLFGDANRTGLCAADTTLATNALGESVEPCASRINTPPDQLVVDPGPAPQIPVEQAVAVPTEFAGYLNPTGPAHAIEARTQEGTLIQGNPNETIYLDLLCEYLGYDSPNTGATYIAVNAVPGQNASFLPDGRLFLDEAPALQWDYNVAAPPYGAADTNVIFETLSCTETVMVDP